MGDFGLFFSGFAFGLGSAILALFIAKINNDRR